MQIGGTTDPSCDESIFLWGEEGGLSKYKGKKHTLGGRGSALQYGQIEHKTHETTYFNYLV
jgi:hypothetical protein